MQSVHATLLTRLQQSVTDPTTERKPCDLYEFYASDYIPDPVNGFEPGDAEEKFAAIEITWDGLAYRRSVVTRSDIQRFMGQQTNSASVNFSNIDRYLATWNQTADIEGMWLVIRYVERDITAGSAVLFVGRCDKPGTINNKSFSINASQEPIDINAELPTKSFTAQDPEGRSPSDPLYEGIRLIAVAGSQTFPQIIPAQNRFARLIGQRDTIYVTRQWSSVDATPYGTPVAEVLGRAQLKLVPFMWADKGLFVAYLMAASAGPIQGIENIKTRTAGFSDPFNLPGPVGPIIHLGDAGNTGTNLGNTNQFQESGYFSHLAYIEGASTGSPADVEDNPPEVTALIIGRKVPLPDGSGVYPAMSDEPSLEWTDNPVHLARWVFAVSGLDENFLEDAVNYLTGLFCDEPLLDESNSERVFIPETDIPATGTSITRYLSTGILNSRLIRHYLGDPVEEPWLLEPPTYEPLDLDDVPGVFTVDRFYRKRYTFNAPIAERVKATDFLNKVLYPAFRGYHVINSKGKVEIRSERASDNCLLRAATGAATAFTGIVAAWHLDEASGTRSDSVGINHLTDNNTVTQAVGKLTNAGQFTRANSEYLSIADNASLSTGNIDFTFSVWVYLDNKTNHFTIISKDGTGQREYYLGYEIGLDRFRFYVFNAAGAAVSATANNLGSPSAATWYHIIAWHDSVADTVNIQVNGGAVDSQATAALVVNDSTSLFSLGGRPSLPTSEYYLDGRIDEVNFWKRVLTSQERTDLYNSSVGWAYGALPTQILVDDVTPWKTNELLRGKLIVGVGLTTSEVRRVSSALYSADGNAITLTAAKTGTIAVAASGATLTGGSTTVQASGTVTITGTPAAGNTVTVTINGRAVVYTLDSLDTTTSVAAMLAHAINADTQLNRYIKATSASNVLTVTAKYGVLNLDSGLVFGHIGPRAAPTVAPTLAASAGALEAGTYKVAYAYVTAIGRTTASPLGSVVLTANQKIDVTSLGALPSDVVSVNWYVSESPNSDKLLYIVNNNGGAFSITALPSRDNPGLPAFNTTAEEAIRIALSFATNTQGATVLAQSGLTRANVKPDTYNFPLGSEQSSVNQIKGSYRDAKNDFALTPFTVNDPVHQVQVGKKKPLEVDFSGVDNWHQAFRLANAALSKNREGDWFDTLVTGTGEALLLEEGDLKTTSDSSGELINVVTRIESLSISPNHEVTIRRARRYSTLMFSDDVRQHDIPLPSTLRYVQTASTLVLYLDLPIWRDADASKGPFIYVAVNRPTTLGDWRGSVIYSEATGSYIAATGTLDVGATMGQASTVLATTTNTATFDNISTVRVQLTTPMAALSNKTEAEARAGANRFALGKESTGWEIGHFTTATLVGGTTDTYDLSGFLRGRHGTEGNVGIHTNTDKFVLLDDTIQTLPLDISLLNIPVNLKAVTVNEDVADATATSVTWTGRSLQPFSISNPRGTRDSGNDILIEFEGRTRVGGGVRSYQAGANNEEIDEYRVQILNSGSVTLPNGLTRIMNVIPGMRQAAVLIAKNGFTGVTHNSFVSEPDIASARTFQEIHQTDNFIEAGLEIDMTGGSWIAFGLQSSGGMWKDLASTLAAVGGDGTGVDIPYLVVFNSYGPGPGPYYQRFRVYEYGVEIFSASSEPAAGDYDPAFGWSEVYSNQGFFKVKFLFVGSSVRIQKAHTVNVPFVTVATGERATVFPYFGVAANPGDGPAYKISSVFLTTYPFPKTFYAGAQQLEDGFTLGNPVQMDIWQHSPLVGPGIKTRVTL